MKISISNLEIEATSQEIEEALKGFRGPTFLDHQQQQIDSFVQVFPPILGVALGMIAFKILPPDKFQTFAAILGKNSGFDPAAIENLVSNCSTPKTSENSTCLESNCANCRLEDRKDVFEFLSKLTGKEQLMDQLWFLEKKTPDFVISDYRPSELHNYAEAIKRYPSLLDMLFDQAEWIRGELYANLTATAAHSLYRALSVELIGCPPPIPPFSTEGAFLYEENVIRVLIEVLRDMFGNKDAPPDAFQFDKILDGLANADSIAYPYSATDESYLFLKDYFSTDVHRVNSNVDQVILDVCKINRGIVSHQPYIRVGVYSWDQIRRGLLVVFPFLNG